MGNLVLSARLQKLVGENFLIFCREVLREICRPTIVKTKAQKLCEKIRSIIVKIIVPRQKIIRATLISWHSIRGLFRFRRWKSPHGLYHPSKELWLEDVEVWTCQQHCQGGHRATRCHHIAGVPLVHSGPPLIAEWPRNRTGSGTEKVPQRTCVRQISPNFRVNFPLRFASKPLFYWVVLVPRNGS